MADEKQSIFKERALWLAFAFLFFVMSASLSYVVSGLRSAEQNVLRLEKENETNKIQWKKISLMREDYWKSQVAQAYKNGCMETAIKYIDKRAKF